MANPINRNATMFQIQDIFENGKPNIILKTIKSFNIKRSSIIILILKKKFKMGSSSSRHV